MILKKIDFNKIQADTIRFCKETTGYRFIGFSPNRGLECYLCEAVLRYSKKYNYLIKTEIKNSLNRVLNEAQNYRDNYFWGWEKNSSVEGVHFPLDWDDTSKVIDLISVIQKHNIDDVTNKNIRIPGAQLWEEELKKSFFDSETVGEDIIINCPHKFALSVFFGVSSLPWPPRDDPMVTITTIRTTALWYPKVLKSLYDQIITLLNRPLFVLNYIFDTDTPFSKISRYYFSTGHFAYRLIETLNILGLNPLDLIQPKLINTIYRASDIINISIKNKGRIDSEVIWWYLIGVNIGILESGCFDLKYLFRTNRINNEIPFVYRHRRLNHYYYAENWVERLQWWEYEGVSSLLKDHTTSTKHSLVTNYLMSIKN